MDQSISQLFHQVQSAALEPSLPSSELQQVIDSSVRLEFAISQAALFSRNETVREVDTDHLPFMLTAYYMAVLHLQRQENRKNALETAEGCLDRFLTLMEEYQVLTQEQKLIWKEGKYHNPRREDAIAWLKQKKAVENALEILRRREDEDGLREFHMMRMQHCIQESFSHLKFCKLEMEMLQMKEQGPLPRPQPSQGLQYVRIDESNAHTMPSVISSFQQLAQAREQIKAKVFTPCFHMPTLTVEEFGEIELKRCQECEAMRAANPPPPQVDSDDEDEEAREARRKKDTAWADWKDEHEKGGGNRLR